MTTFSITPDIEARLQRLADKIFQPPADVIRQPVYVMTVGFSLSGKSYFVGRHPQLKHFFQFQTDPIHHRLNREFPFLQDDRTIRGPGFQPRQKLTQRLRWIVTERALTAELAFVNASANLKPEDRRERLAQAKSFHYQTIIIWVQCEEAALYRRLRQADAENIRRRLAPAWIDLYERVQRERFIAPTPDEADGFVRFQSGHDDPKAVRLPFALKKRTDHIG